MNNSSNSHMFMSFSNGIEVSVLVDYEHNLHDYPSDYPADVVPVELYAANIEDVILFDCPLHKSRFGKLIDVDELRRLIAENYVAELVREANTVE